MSPVKSKTTKPKSRMEVEIDSLPKSARLGSINKFARPPTLQDTETDIPFLGDAMGSIRMSQSKDDSSCYDRGAFYSGSSRAAVELMF